MAVAQFSGLASGIDSASLIDAIIEARSRSNELRRKDIDFLESESESLAELNTKALALNDLLDKFRTINGGGVSKRSASSDSSIVSASVTSAATNATTTIIVTSIASAATASFNDSYSSTSSAFAPNAVGTQTIGVDIGTGGNLVSIDIDVTDTMTIQEYVDAFNSHANAVGRATATLTNMGTTDSPSYRVVINSLKEGVSFGTIAFDVPTAGAGFGGNDDLQTRTVDQATNATFSLSGISGTITRASNAVSDVVSGVTFNLSKVGTADITVSDDADSSTDLFGEIVDAFNDLVEFVKENNKVTRSESGGQIVNTYGTLAKTKVDDDLISRFRSTLSGAFATGGTSVFGFADLGISTNRDGTLAFDAEKFKTALSGDPFGTTSLFRMLADQTAGVGGFLYEYTKFGGFIDIARRSNATQIETLNTKISQLERTTAKLRENLQGQFSRLETVTAKLQSTQQQLTGILDSLRA